MLIAIIQFVIILIIVSSAFFVFFTKSLVHACFATFVTFVSIAALYITFSADFVGVSQIVIYVGGILILFLFGVFITKSKSKAISIENDWNIFSILTAITVSVLLYFVNFSLFKNADEGQLKGSQVQNIGLEIITTQILPFEIIGIILLIALIGTTFIAATKK